MRFDSPKQRLQDDLIWAANSVDMMRFDNIPAAQGLTSTANSPASTALHQWLYDNGHETALLQLVEERKPRRLGIYFEVLWQYILEHYPGYELITRNLPVISNKRTLGEMDFIYFCKSRQRYIHLETAVKFYLGLPVENGQEQMVWSNWLGPGCIDRLDIKLDKMLNNQTRISTTPEGLATLKQKGIDNALQEICLKGYFFYPYKKDCQSPEQSHEHHSRGFWLKESQIPTLPYETNWHIMKKEEWLSPVTLAAEQPLFNRPQLKESIANCLAIYKFPLMIAYMQKTKQGFKEEMRFFITPNDWPQLEADNN